MGWGAILNNGTVIWMNLVQISNSIENVVLIFDDPQNGLCSLARLGKRNHQI